MLIAPPKYTKSTICLYSWPAAVTVNGTYPPPFLYMISVLASDTVSPNAAHAVTITVIIFSNPSGDRDTMPASSAYSIPHNVWASSPFLSPSTLPARALLLFFSPFSFVGDAPCCP